MTENKGDLISREALKKSFEDTVCIEPMPYAFVKQIIDNAPTVELKDIYQEGHYDGHLEGYTKAINEERPQGEWYENIPKGCFKARHGDYVLYKVDFLLDNLAREVNIMEGARKMRGGENEID